MHESTAASIAGKKKQEFEQLIDQAQKAAEHALEHISSSRGTRKTDTLRFLEQAKALLSRIRDFPQEQKKTAVVNAISKVIKELGTETAPGRFGQYKSPIQTIIHDIKLLPYLN